MHARSLIVMFFLGFPVMTLASDLQINLDIKNNKPINSCDAIVATISIINIGESSKTIASVFDIDNYMFISRFIFSDSEKKLDYVGPAKNIIGKNSIVTLYPDYSLSRKFIITCDQYDYSKSGKYRLSVIYTGDDLVDVLSSAHYIQSNTVNIEVKGRQKGAGGIKK